MSGNGAGGRDRRWYVYTDRGRKIVWAPTAAVARGRARRHGLTVERVVPAGHELGEWPA